MEGRSYIYNDVVPCTAMIAVELANVVINILYKAASSKGMRYYTFTAYTHALATLSLLPFSFFFIRKNGLPPFNFSFISKLCLLGIVGFAGIICTYKGLELGSPTLSSAISNLIPAFTFILAVFFRMEKIALRSISSQAKIIGTIASVSGATIFVMYKGPKVLPCPQYNWTSPSHLLQHPLQLQSSQSNWLIAGLLLAVGNLCYSLWSIIQTPIMKIYPEEITVTYIYNLLVTILSVPVCLLAEPDMSSWTLTPSTIVVVSVLYTGVFASSFSSAVHTWGVRLKGPVYVATFSPLSIVIAAFLGAIFLGDALYLGSVIGALILSAGLYAVLWGKSKEEGTTLNDSGCKVHLLQSHKDEEM